MKTNGLAWLFLLVLLAGGCGREEPTPLATAHGIGADALDHEIKAKAEGGDLIAQLKLADCYAFGKGVPQDYTEAVKWFRRAAQQNDVDAQFNLGVCYYGGMGVAVDYTEAVKWFRKAAEQNSADAQFNLGTCYDSGQGVSPDKVEAIKWYRKSAEQNLAYAQFNLGRHYSIGDGVAQNFTEAVKWLRKAAEQNVADAQSDLGSCYYNGEGVVKDFPEAVKWYRKAAEQNNANGQYMLGNCYASGNGVTKDSQEAIRWYSKAAAQNDADAQFMLAGIYAIGDGVTEDNKAAYKWALLAASHGTNAVLEMELMQRIISETQKHLSGDQIIEVRREVHDFEPSPTGIKGPILRNEIIDSNPGASGTAFFITDDGFLISNYHVIKDATKVRLVTGAGLIGATVVKVDMANDLALLKATGMSAPLPIAASRTVKLGSTVATVGFPDIGLQGFTPKLAKGEIASLAGAADDPRYFQISLPVQPGNSGGALVDARGNVVGIVAAKLDASAALAATGALPENVNYAVKSSLLLSFLESVPDVAAKLKEPNTKDEAFEDVVKSAQDAAVLVLVY